MTDDDWVDEQAENAKADALLARLEARRRVEKAVADAELVYKTREDALVPREAARVQDIGFGTDALDNDGWNAWARQVAHREFVRLEATLIDDIDAAHDAMQAKFDQLNAKLTELEAKVAVLERSGGADRSVVPLRRGGTDAAA
jgi:hypothetical protein